MVLRGQTRVKNERLQVFRLMQERFRRGVEFPRRGGVRVSRPLTICSLIYAIST